MNIGVAPFFEHIISLSKDAILTQKQIPFYCKTDKLHVLHTKMPV